MAEVIQLAQPAVALPALEKEASAVEAQVEQAVTVNATLEALVDAAQAIEVKESKEGPQLCVHCQKRPMGKKAFCGPSCRLKSRFRRSMQLDWIKVVFPERPPVLCSLEGCDTPVTKSKLKKRTPAFCSEDHRRISMSPCLHCKSKGAEKSFCTPECIKELAASGKTSLLEIPRAHELFTQLETNFNTTWLQGAKPPKVLHMYQIVIPQPLYDRYKQYRDTEGKNNEELRWHGTFRNCKVGDDGNTTICNNHSVCFLCSILVNSFDAAKSRCGGVFTASTSAYSNGFSRDTVPGPTKAMLLGAVSHFSPNVVVTSTPRNETLRPAYLLIYSAK